MLYTTTTLYLVKKYGKSLLTGSVSKATYQLMAKFLKQKPCYDNLGHSVIGIQPRMDNFANYLASYMSKEALHNLVHQMLTYEIEDFPERDRNPKIFLRETSLAKSFLAAEASIKYRFGKCWNDFTDDTLSAEAFIAKQALPDSVKDHYYSLIAPMIVGTTEQLQALESSDELSFHVGAHDSVHLLPKTLDSLISRNEGLLCKHITFSVLSKILNSELESKLLQGLNPMDWESVVTDLWLRDSRDEAKILKINGLSDDKRDLYKKQIYKLCEYATLEQGNIENNYAQQVQYYKGPFKASDPGYCLEDAMAKLENDVHKQGQVVVTTLLPVVRQSIEEDNDNTLLHVVTMIGNAAIKDAADDEEPLLHVAIQSGNTEAVNILLTCPNINLNQTCLVKKKNITPLQRAAKLGHQEIAVALIRNGANPSGAVDVAKRHHHVELASIINYEAGMVQPNLITAVRNLEATVANLKHNNAQLFDQLSVAHKARVDLTTDLQNAYYKMHIMELALEANDITPLPFVRVRRQKSTKAQGGLIEASADQATSSSLPPKLDSGEPRQTEGESNESLKNNG